MPDPVSALALAACLSQQPAWLVGRPRARMIARSCVSAGPPRNVSPVLLGAVVLAETGGKNTTYPERAGGCSVSPFQIYAPRCLVRRVVPLKTRPFILAAREAARILALGRRVCARLGNRIWYCRTGRWYCRYNPGSYNWCRVVTRNLATLKRCLHARQYKRIARSRP